MLDRQADARKKIMLGGLFVKAGLDHFHPHDPALLYGLLLEAKSRLSKDGKPLENHYRQLGKELMIGGGKKGVDEMVENIENKESDAVVITESS